MKLTAEQWKARYIAWQEAADHLRMTWTEDAEEKKQGGLIAADCERKADYCLRRALET
jgi:hypothetical protein